ncbi:MAG TPA: ABC transporter ATP-binding protein [Phycisphaerales bacterium]|nr:ABC transporter ATP-binding protein [Phycisphaerales bacterium]
MTSERIKPDTDDAPILEIENLTVKFHSQAGQPVTAVRGALMSIFKRQTLAVVGESGSGKSVTALSVLRLLPKNAAWIESGQIRYEGKNLLEVRERDMRSVRGGEIAMVFQEPMTSLNPVMTIGAQIREAVELHQHLRGSAAKDAVIVSLDRAGITDAATRMKAYPHEFSGGMRQRVMIAMALACEPKVLLADEPTTALDVTIGERILDLLDELKQERGLAMMLITHDLGIVAERADVVCVMFKGCVVEYATAESLFAMPLHPYTRGLIACRPSLTDRKARLTTIRDAAHDSHIPFTGSHSELQAWWPDGAEASDGHAMIQVLPNHWVRCVQSGHSGQSSEKMRIAHRTFAGQSMATR